MAKFDKKWASDGHNGNYRLLLLQLPIRHYPKDFLFSLRERPLNLKWYFEPWLNSLSNIHFVSFFPVLIAQFFKQISPSD
jgi:hypothetical protein